MGLSTSLFAGISGLERHQQRLDVIGNNLANVNTYGFKQQRVLFQDILYQTIRPGIAPDADNGGLNPSQIGVGVDLAVIDTNFNQGSFETTGIDSDLAIDGNGFFVLRSGEQHRYTRDGAFSINTEQKLVNPGSGMYVQGWNLRRDNTGTATVNTGGALSDVVIPLGSGRMARATSKVEFNGNLNNAGTISTSGSLLNSQRLFSTKTGDTEISSGAIDIKNVYMKDPAGGVDNVRLFKGTGSDGTDNTVLRNGDLITVQLVKGARSLEAIFTYGIKDTVNNTSGDLGPDGMPDPGTEHYDGTTLNDFTSWFNTAFGLVSVEDSGASKDTNAAHGVDGDNPNDMVDMGKGGANPFTDETDASGYNLVLSAKGGTGLTGETAIATPAVPKAAIENSTRQYSIVAGSAGDVGVANSYIDIDGDGAFSRDKDIVLEGVQSYVVTGNSTVSLGAVPFGSTSLNKVLKAFDTSVDNSDMYIDVGDNGVYDKGVDPIIRGAFSQNVFNAVKVVDSKTPAAADGVTTLVVTHDGTNLGITKGMFFSITTVATPVVYTVVSVTENSSGDTEVTLDKAENAVDGALTAAVMAAGVTYQGAALVRAGYTATSSTAAGSTLLTNLNVPVAIQHPTTGMYVGKSFYTTVVDNEKGAAGAQVIEGDAKVMITQAPARIGATVAITVGTDVNNLAGVAYRTLTVSAADLALLRTGQTIMRNNTLYTIVKKDSTANVITFDKADATGTDFANGDVLDFNGIVYIDADNSGTQPEVIYRVRNDMDDSATATSGSLFIDLNKDGVKDNTDLVVSSGTTIRNLAAYSDDAVVFTSTTTGLVYRKVPTKYDTTNMTVYLDKMNKGTLDEPEFKLVKVPAANSGAANNIWVLDEDGDGQADSGENTVVSTTAITGTMTGDTATINLPSASSLNSVRTGSGRIQIRGNTGTVNALSDISFISGADKTERTIFQNNSLTNGTDNASSEAAAASGESVVQNIVVYDSTGKSHDVAITFVLDRKTNDKSEWTWFAECADAAQQTGFFPSIDPRGAAPGINVGTGKVVFDNFGRFLRAEPSTPLISIPLEGSNTDSALQIKPNFSIITGFASSSGSELDVRSQDGYASGTMDSYSVGTDGKITGIYTNGMRETVAQIALASFTNPDGLTRDGANMFSVSANSGNAMVGAAVTGDRGAIRSKTLELSNVDITTEFTNMIITQRAYQANSRVITKSDELLQELLQIVR